MLVMVIGHESYRHATDGTIRSAFELQQDVVDDVTRNGFLLSNFSEKRFVDSRKDKDLQASGHTFPGCTAASKLSIR